MSQSVNLSVQLADIMSSLLVFIHSQHTKGMRVINAKAVRGKKFKYGNVHQQATFDLHTKQRSKHRSLQPHMGAIIAQLMGNSLPAKIIIVLSTSIPNGRKRKRKQNKTDGRRHKILDLWKLCTFLSLSDLYVGNFLKRKFPS